MADEKRRKVSLAQRVGVSSSGRLKDLLDRRVRVANRKAFHKKFRDQAIQLENARCNQCEHRDENGVQCTNRAACLKGCKRFCKRHAYYSSRTKCVDEKNADEYMQHPKDEYVVKNWPKSAGPCSSFAINNLLRANIVSPTEMNGFADRAHFPKSTNKTVRHREGINRQVTFEFLYHLGLRLYDVENFSYNIDDSSMDIGEVYEKTEKNMNRFRESVLRDPTVYFVGFINSISFVDKRRRHSSHVRTILYANGKWYLYCNAYTTPQELYRIPFLFDANPQPWLREVVDRSYLIGVVCPVSLGTLTKATNYNPYKYVPPLRVSPLSPDSNIDEIFERYTDADGHDIKLNSFEDR